MNDSVKWGILACGSIAHKFAKGIQACPASELHAVAARDAGRAQAFAQEHGVSRAYGTYEGLLADPEVEAVYISTIHPRHLEWIGRAVQAGKHVLCEKPLAMNLREAKRAADLARKHRCLLREAFMYRHHPQTQKVIDIVESGALGRVCMIDASFCFNSGVLPESRLQAKSLGGGGILDVGCYAVSLARLVAGRAQGRLFAEPLELKAVGHLDAQLRTDMWSSAVLRFEGDIVAKCTCAVRTQATNEATIFGEFGRIVVDRPWHCDEAVRVEFDDERDAEIYDGWGDRSLYAYEIESFARELRGTPVAPNEVAMRLDDTLGNMKALDWWRAEIGLAYEADRGSC